MLFPLPLTPFERYYLADDSPEYPTTIPVEVVLSGTLDEAHFRQALRQNVARHPLLHALVAEGPAGPEWITCPVEEPWLDWNDAAAPIGHPDGEFIDLSQQPGLRVWVRATPHEARLLIQLHHACCDGVSTLQFIGDLLAHYAAAQQATDPRDLLPELPLERLCDRAAVDTGDAGDATFLTGLRDLWVTTRVWGRVLLRRCAPLLPPEQHEKQMAIVGAAESHRQFLAFETQVLSADDTHQLQKLAAALGVTTNDVLLRDALLTIRDWNRAQGARRVGACRINMPVYVRGRAVPPMPASNGIGFSFVTVRPDRHSAETILTEVHEQTRQIKQWKLALYFLGGLAAVKDRPAIMRRVLAPATAGDVRAEQSRPGPHAEPPAAPRRRTTGLRQRGVGTRGRRAAGAAVDAWIDGRDGIRRTVGHRAALRHALVSARRHPRTVERIRHARRHVDPPRLVPPASGG